MKNGRGKKELWFGNSKILPIGEDLGGAVILVLCTGNSCRSQMAEGFLKKLISPPQPFQWEGAANPQGTQQTIRAHEKTYGVFSVGIEAHGLNPQAVKVMREIGIDISKHQSKSLEQLFNAFPFGEGWDGAVDFVITVCDNAKESCPVFPKAKIKIHRNFSDPAKATGAEEEILNQFRKVRDEIGKFCKDFVEKNLT